MRSLLLVKGVSEGDNTAELGGSNCHILVSPPFASHLGGHAIVAKDQRVPLLKSSVSLVDLNYTLAEVERFKMIVPISEIESTESSQGFKLADYCLIDRMTYSKLPEWTEIPRLEMAAAFRMSHPAKLFFGDLGFLASDHGRAMEEALCARGLVTTTSIKSSLASAVEGRPWSTLARAILNPIAKSLCEVVDVNSDYAHSHGFDHYLGVLAFRKMLYRVIESDILFETGVKPSSEECFRAIENLAGSQGRRLAEEGHRRSDDPTLFLGEELLVSSLLAAILRGTDVVVLTREPLLLAQFMKLCQILSGDYCAFRLWHTESEQFKHAITGLGGPAPVELQNIYSSPVLKCGLDSGWKESALPKNPYLVNLHCWLLEPTESDTVRVAPVTFCAERPMYGLLKSKGQYQGSNIADPLGMNVRMSFGGPAGIDYACIGRDRIVPFGHRDCPSDARLKLSTKGMPAMDLMFALQGGPTSELPCLAEV